MTHPLLCIFAVIIALPATQAQVLAGESHQHDTHHHAPAPESPAHGLSLDRDQRWLMDDHTRNAFARMKSTFAGAELASAEQRKAAALQLKGDLNELIQGCTMTGAAHDQLHKYLTVYIPAVDQLAATGDSDSEQRISELLDVFPVYFQ